MGIEQDGGGNAYRRASPQTLARNDKMKITIKYNIMISLALVGYVFVLSPLLIDDQTPLLVETICEGNIPAIAIVSLISVVLSIVVSMLIIRSLWNRLFPKLCNWNEINLAESYALSLFFTVFLLEYM